MVQCHVVLNYFETHSLNRCNRLGRQKEKSKENYMNIWLHNRL
jgi:hypothetical protein